MDNVLQFLFGGLAVMCGVVGFFFLHYWNQQRDRLFVYFMLAFWSFAVSWGMHLVYASAAESGAHVYAFRLVGFVLIIAAIVDKNRSAQRK